MGPWEAVEGGADTRCTLNGSEVSKYNLEAERSRVRIIALTSALSDALVLLVSALLGPIGPLLLSLISCPRHEHHCSTTHLDSLIFPAMRIPGYREDSHTSDKLKSSVVFTGATLQNIVPIAINSVAGYLPALGAIISDLNTT